MPDELRGLIVIIFNLLPWASFTNKPNIVQLIKGVPPFSTWLTNSFNQHPLTVTILADLDMGNKSQPIVQVAQAEALTQNPTTKPVYLQCQAALEWLSHLPFSLLGKTKMQPMCRVFDTVRQEREGLFY